VNARHALGHSHALAVHAHLPGCQLARTGPDSHSSLLAVYATRACLIAVIMFGLPVGGEVRLLACSHSVHAAPHSSKHSCSEKNV